MDVALLPDDDELAADALPSQSESCLPSTLDLISTAVRRWFPTIQHMTTPELDARLTQTLRDGRDTCAKTGAQLLLLDVREPAEFAVSHIPSAINISPSAYTSPDAVRELLASAGAQRDAEIVCYCSVGVRSSQLALAIAKVDPRRVSRVHNLDGSIFRWANEGRRLVNSRLQPTAYVHPYSNLWGRLVRTDLRAFEQD